MKTSVALRVVAFALAVSGSVAVAAAVEPKKPDARQVERGKYMVLVGGCNDCHTEAFAPRDGKVAEKDWLLGNSLGFRGP